MSLKSFHVIFIYVAMLLFACVATWALVLTRETSLTMQIMGYGSSALAAALFFYGIYFIRKSRKLIV